MAEIINLRRVRRQKARTQAERNAAVRRVEHGQSKAERNLSAAREEKARKDLDGRKRDPGE